MPAACAPIPSLTGLTALSAELRAQARRLCRESNEVRAHSRTIAQSAERLCQRAASLGAFPAPWQPTSARPAPLAIGGGAATEEVLRDFIVATCLGPGETTLRDDEPLLANGILDSLGVVRLAAFIEERFGIVVPDEALVPEHFATLQRVAALVERLEAHAGVR
jgi:acyl carrier protein